MYIAYFTMSLNRKVTTCARVQVPFGTKVVAVTPVVMPFSTAQRIASKE